MLPFRTVLPRSIPIVCPLEAGFSPDGRWIAYASNESGRFEVYVIPSTGSGGKWQISSGGGQQPVWRSDGSEIFYLTDDENLVSVPVTLKPESVQLGAAQHLFRLTNAIAGNVGILTPYDVTQDGKRFLVITANQGKVPPITLDGGTEAPMTLECGTNPVPYES